jgi:hypothetical protein
LQPSFGLWGFLALDVMCWQKQLLCALARQADNTCIRRRKPIVQQPECAVCVPRKSIVPPSVWAACCFDRALDIRIRELSQEFGGSDDVPAQLLHSLAGVCAWPQLPSSGLQCMMHH